MAIQLATDWAEAHNLLGIVLEEAGRTEQAIAAYRRAVDLDAAFLEARENLMEAQAELRQEAGPDVLHGGDAAVVQALLAGQDLQEGGLAAAVGADQPDAVAGVDLPVRAFKQQPLAVSFAGGN